MVQRSGLGVPKTGDGLTKHKSERPHAVAGEDGEQGDSTPAFSPSGVIFVQCETEKKGFKGDGCDARYNVSCWSGRGVWLGLAVRYL